jgi:hypothetical protein
MGPLHKNKILWIAIALLLVTGTLIVRHQSRGVGQSKGVEQASAPAVTHGVAQGLAQGTAKNNVGTGTTSSVTASSTVSVSGSTSTVAPGVATAPVAVAPVVIAQEAPPQEAQGCFVVTYHHKKMSSHADGEACLRHKNLISLKAEKVNPASVCVRVNGKAVAHEFQGKHAVVIGAVAGMNAEITTRYCTGKITCHEECKVQKDEFLSAIGGEDGDTVADAGWDGASGKDDADLETEVKALDRDIASEDSKGSVFKDWIMGSEVVTCQQHAALGK